MVNSRFQFAFDIPLTLAIPEPFERRPEEQQMVSSHMALWRGAGKIDEHFLLRAEIAYRSRTRSGGTCLSCGPPPSERASASWPQSSD